MTMGHSELVFEAERKPTDSYKWYYINLAIYHKLLQKYMENISMMIYNYQKSATPKQVQTISDLSVCQFWPVMLKIILG